MMYVERRKMFLFRFQKRKFAVVYSYLMAKSR